ncbi:MAG: hypothetical protein NVSMB68_03640 [Thermoanaerobaculia bacterium]
MLGAGCWVLGAGCQVLSARYQVLSAGARCWGFAEVRFGDLIFFPRLSVPHELNSFRDLIAWQKAMDLVDAVYGVTRSFPSSETFGLTAQMRKAAGSIPSDIAEGRGRHTTADYRHFLREARGGLQELETQIEIATRQNYIESRLAQTIIDQVHEVGRLINGLLRSLPGT